MSEIAKIAGTASEMSQTISPSSDSIQAPAPDARQDGASLAPPPATLLASATSSGRVRQLAGAYIEPITRFSQADLHETAPEQQSRLVAIMTSTQRVNIQANYREFSGKARGGTIKVPTSPDVYGSTERLREAALATLPERASAWAALDTDEYRRLLPSRPFLSGFTESYGYEYGCSPCFGNGKVTCEACNGARRITCDPCKGRGRTRCNYCHGDKRTRCLLCGGRGSGYRWEYVTEWDTTTNMNVSVQRQVDRICACNMGYNACNYCQQRGELECAYCNGKKMNPCKGCRETGMTSCKDCDATGWRYKLGFLESHVSTDETLELHHPDATALALLKPRLTIPELTQHTQLISVRHKADGARITSIYQTEVLVTKASLSAAGLEFSLFGFGPETEIFDYQNIAGKLLQADVKALDAAIAESSAWRIRGGDAVLEAASVFVKSELNLLIAESVTEVAPDGASFVSASVEGKFKGLVDEAYITRASAVFKLALGRIYQPQMIEPGLYCTGIALLATAAAYGLSWPSRSWALPLGLAIGAVCWFGVEFNNRRRIHKLFPGTVGERILTQIDATGLPARLRGYAFGAAVAGWFVAMWFVTLFSA